MELFRLLGTIAVDNEAAIRALNETSQQASDTSNETSEAFNRIGSVAGGMVKSFAIAGAAIGAAWIATIEATREYRTEMGLLDTAFQVSGHSSEAAKDTYSELNSIMRDSGAAVEASQHLAKLTDNEKDLATWTDICTGVYATFGASIPIESLTESANEVAKSGVLTGGLVDALVWAGISEEEFQASLDACTTEQERQNLIMNTLDQTYKEASDQYKETNKDVIEAEKANEALADAFAEIGAIGEPILTAIKEKVAEMVQAAVPLLQSFVDKVKDLKQWIQDNEDTINNWVAVIIGAGTAIGTFLLILNWGTIMTAAANAVKTVRLAILALNTAMMANPIGLVVSLIAGLVAAFIYLWQTNEEFREFWIDLWKKIQEATKKTVDAIQKFFSNLWKDIQAVWSGVKDWFSNLFQGAADKVKAAFNLVGWFKNKAGEVRDSFVNTLKALPSKVADVFADVRDRAIERMNSMRDKVKGVIDKVKGFFNIDLKFKGLKYPTISLTLQKGKGLMQKAAELIGLDGIPKFSVKWNAEGGILTKPTIFGLNENGFLGGGEAGSEAVAPITLLQDYIRDVVRNENEGISSVVIDQNRLLMEFLARIIPDKVMLDSGALVGELAPSIDMKLSDRWNHSKRGNTR